MVTLIVKALHKKSVLSALAAVMRHGFAGWPISGFAAPM
jgi:hypothetical protein